MVWVAVAVGMAVLVDVSVLVGRGVQVWVGVALGGMGVEVEVAVEVAVAVAVKVEVEVEVAVAAGEVAVAVAVPVAQPAPEYAMYSFQASRVPTSSGPPSVISSRHTPCAGCPSRGDRLPTSGKYVPWPGGQTAPMTLPPEVTMEKPVLEAVHTPLPQTWVNSSIRVPCGLIRNTRRSLA